MWTRKVAFVAHTNPFKTILKGEIDKENKYTINLKSSCCKHQLKLDEFFFRLSSDIESQIQIEQTY